jgi:hypothetical protein
MSGQWQPFRPENELEPESTEIAESVEPETDDSETDSRIDSSKRDSRFRRRID